MKPFGLASGLVQGRTETSPEARLWDFLVIGAGPAGSLAAHELAKYGAAVLLVDKAAFPRHKPCGGCLSWRALRELELSGLGHLARELGAKRLGTLYLGAEGRRARIRIPESAGLSRESLDAALIHEACAQGVTFLPETKGVFEKAEDNAAVVRLASEGREFTARARMVLATDGLLGTALSESESYPSSVAPDSMVGVSTVLEAGASPAEEGTIYMACGKEGYVGLVRREDDKLEIAAALRPQFLRAAGTPGACAALFDQAGFDIPAGLKNADWKGTAPLTRERQILAGRRLFILGDAAGYVEPFTGEGIYWAFLQARALTSLLHSLRFEWYDALEEEWPRLYAKLMDKRRRACRAMTRLLRFAAFRRAVLRGLGLMPWLAGPVVKSIHGSGPEKETSRPYAGRGLSKAAA
ncbi:MAG TPA: FAD-dependent monooxygenase [Verrucomicrobiae bacterium]|nr:FAD-dependent monooxygenase [Verrucomicrobiae bacterium]